MEADKLRSKSGLTQTPCSEEEGQILCFHIGETCDQINRTDLVVVIVVVVVVVGIVVVVVVVVAVAVGLVVHFIFAL